MANDPWAQFNPQPAPQAGNATVNSHTFPGVIHGPASGPKDPNPGVGYKMNPDGTATYIRGGPHDPNANSTDTPGDTTKSGDDYLATLPAGLAGQVRALSEGRRAFPTGTALKDPKVQELIAAATQYDPALDASNAATRVATRKDFTSGVSARNITAINTALGHIETLSAAADALHNRSFPLWNAAANFAETETGDNRVKNFNIARDAVANELMRVFRGTGAGSVQEIHDWQEAIGSSDSPEQLQGELGKAADLLNSRLQAMQDQYSKGMGRSSDVYQFLTPHARAVLEKLAPGSTPAGQAPAAKSGKAPTVSNW